MATNIPTTSPPDTLRTRHLATNYFGANAPGALMAAIPRVKYMYYANFVPSSAALSLYSTDLTNIANPGPGGLNFKVRTVDKPKVDLTQVELNQYNRKRYAYTKVTYQPISISLFDTVDDVPLLTWIDYFTFYFGDPRTKNSYAYNQSVVDPTFFDSSGWGFRPVAERLNFFDRIELYTLFGQTFSQVNYINPKITMVDWQQQDSSSSDSQELTMQFNYETLQYVVSNAPITSTLATAFGWTVDAPPIEVAQLNFGNQSTNTSNNGSIAALSGLFAGVSGVSVFSEEAAIGSATGLLAAGSSLGTLASSAIGSAVNTVTGAASSISSSLGGFASGL
jgi:hypothetical protein